MSLMKPIEGTEIKSCVVCVNQPDESDKKTIVVLGVERGGTSMVAGVLRAMDINFGDEAGRNHEDRRFLSDNEDELIHLIQLNNSQHNVWGFKVPKASLKVEFYCKYLRNPHFILVFRNITSIVDSRIIRGGVDPLKLAQHAINYYNKAVNSLAESRKPLIFVNYESACINKHEFIQDVADFAGIKLNNESSKRAFSIITSDGGGYLDIPEFYFHMESLNPLLRTKNGFPVKQDPMIMHFCKLGMKAVDEHLKLLPNEKYFPKVFYIRFKLKTNDIEFLEEKGLRIVLKFAGKVSSSRLFRPKIYDGLNLLKISNNGNIEQINFETVRSGIDFYILNIKCFENIDESTIYKKMWLQRFINDVYKEVKDIFNL